MKRCHGALGQQLVIALLGAAALLTRLADGYAWCQEYWNWDGKRHSSTDGRRWPANDGVVITYINGIFHSVPDWESITHQLQTIFGHEVRPFYNPSSGWWITDASKAGYHLLRKPANDTIAHALGEHLAQAVEDVGRGRVLHIAHSGGALITYLAAQHHLTKRQRDKIDVLTFGGARSITRKYFSGRVVNYYARNDPLVKLDRRAAELMKLTNNTKFQEINEKHNTTFVFLEGRAKQFVLDHSLEGPTYQHALRKEARAFRRAHFGPLSPLSWDYDQSVFRLARKKVAQLSGLHHFFNTDPLGLRLVRKGIARLTGLHGFFSGKSRSGAGAGGGGGGGGGGAVVPVASENKEGAVGEGGRALEGSRWWWWPLPRASGNKSGQESDAIVPPLVVEEGPGEISGSGGRFWIGFRWTRRGSDKEDQAESAGVGGSSDGVTGDQNLKGEPPLSSVVVAPKSRSLFTRVRRNFWGLGLGSGADADAEVENVDIIDVPESEESEEGTVEGDAKAGAAEARSNSRPWLFSGWTPWGGRAESTPDDEPVPATAAADDVAAVEAQEEQPLAEAEKARDGEEGGGGATHMVGSAGVGDETTGPPSVSREDLSSIRRWWFGSSGTKVDGNVSPTEGAAGESGRDSGSKAAGGEELEDDGKGEKKGDGGKTEETAGGESEGDLRGQASENDEGEAGDAAFSATSGTSAQASALSSGLAEGDKEEKKAETSTSATLLRRWWPIPTAKSSGGGGVEPVLAEETADSAEQQQQQQQQEGTEEATSIPPALSPSASASAEQEQQLEPEDVDVLAPADGAQDDQSAPPPPSLLRRWWPTSKLQRLEETTTPSLDSADDARGYKVVTGTTILVEEAEDAPAEADAPSADVPGVDGVPGLEDGGGPRDTLTEEERGIGHELPRAAAEETLPLPESAPEHSGQREIERAEKGEEEIADVATSDASGAETSPTAAAAAVVRSAVDDEGPSSGQVTTPRPPLVSRFWDVFTNRATEPEEVSPLPRVDDAASSDDVGDKHGNNNPPVAPAGGVGNSVDLPDAATRGKPDGVPVDTERAEGAGEASIRDSGEVFVSEGFLQIGEVDRDVEGDRGRLPLSPPVENEEGNSLGGSGDKEAGKSMNEEESRGEGRESGEPESIYREGPERGDSRDADGDAKEEGETREEVRPDDEASKYEAMIHAARRAERQEGRVYEKEKGIGEGWGGEDWRESDDVGAGGGREGLERQEKAAPPGGTGAAKEGRVMNDKDNAEARR